MVGIGIGSLVDDFAFKYAQKQSFLSEILDISLFN